MVGRRVYRLQTTVPTYGNTINIKTLATENEVGLIPTIEIIEEGHALTIAQQNGISFNKALEIAGSILGREHSREGPCEVQLDRRRNIFLILQVLCSGGR